jgi:VWFA-related protein
MRRKGGQFLLTGILLLVGSGSDFNLPAQLNQTVDRALQNEVTVRFKLIQVYVADKKGNPVSDMKPEDFEIKDNGMPKQVEHFERHDVDMLEEKESPPEGAKAAPQKPAEPARRKFFLLFDTAFNEHRGLKRAQEAALDFLETQASPSDEVGVVSYSSLKGLTIHEYLTGDIERVREVVKKIGLKGVLGRAEELEGIAFKDIEIESGADPVLGFEAEFKRDRYTQQVLDYLNDVRDMAKALGRIPGCKNIILFSGGFAGFLLTGARYVETVENPQGAEEYLGYGKAADVRAGNAGVRTAYADMIRELKASNCPVYSFDVARPRFSSDSYEKLRPDPSSSSQRDLWGLESLQQLSRETGGRYFSNSSNPKTALREIQKITGTYYVLGFPVEETWDGKFHKVEVSVKRKGCSVYGESGYYNPKPYAEYTTFEKQLHLIDLALGKEPYFQEKLQIPFRALLCPGHDSTAVSLLAEISRPELGKLAGGRIEAVAFLFDERGKILFSNRDKFGLTDVPGKSIYQTLTAALPAGRYDCRIVLRNLETGRGARAQAAVLIPEQKKESGIRVYPPLLLLENAGTGYLGNPQALSAAFPGDWDFSSYRPIVGPGPAGLDKLTALVQCRTGEVAEPDVRFSTALIHLASGEIIPCSAKVVSQSVDGPLQSSLIDLAFSRLAPGEYSLYVFALEAKSANQSKASSVFRVE